MKRLWLLALPLAHLLFVAPALAQQGASTPPGNAATTSDLAGCLYRTSPTAAADKQQRAIQCDANGNLKVTVSGTSPVSGTVAIDQTTPGTTNGVVTNSGSVTNASQAGTWTDTVTQATAANLNADVVGNVADAAADSGNSVKTGCVVASTFTSYSNANRQSTPCDSNAAAWVALKTPNSANAVSYSADNADGASASSVASRALSVSRNTIFNGSTWDREFTCANTASVNVTAGNTTQIVALSGSTVIRVCSVAVGESLAGTVQFLTGTGANCGTPATIMTAIPLATSAIWVQSAPAGSSLFRSTAGGEICLAAVTGNITGFITYAQY